MDILIKIGSAIIAPDGHISDSWIEKKASEIAELSKDNNVIIVSSGAVSAGMEIKEITKRPSDVTELQVLSGLGQPFLFDKYRKAFKKQGIDCAQVLLTHHNFSHCDEESNVKKVIEAYMDRKIIPIINENDVVTNEELKANTDAKRFTDNDALAALVAVNMGVDRFIILTDVDGLCEDNPKNNLCAKLIREVNDIDSTIIEKAKHETTSLGLGGMYSKVMAAKAATEKNIVTIISNGKYDVNDILEGNVNCTKFTGY